MRRSEIPCEMRGSCWPTRSYASHQSGVLTGGTGWNRVEQTGVPDALALLNTEDARHLECLAWAIYNGTLLVGLQLELSGTRPWHTVLVGLQRHIYRGRDDAAHCPPRTLGSWDYEEWVQALHRVGGLSG